MKGMKVCRGSHTRSWYHLPCSAQGQSISWCTVLSWREEGGSVLVSSPVIGARAEGNGMRQCHWRFKLEVRKKFCTRRVVGQWNVLPRAVVIAAAWDSQVVFVQCSQAQYVIMWGEHVQSQALDFSDSSRPLPAENILWFYDLKSSFLQKKKKKQSRNKRIYCTQGSWELIS